MNSEKQKVRTEERLKKLVSRISKRWNRVLKEIIADLIKRYGINPIVILNDCIGKEEWFKGIVLSTAYFEGVGRLVLTASLEDKISDKRLKYCNLEQIILLLFASGNIDQKTYSLMMEVKNYRNKLVHIDLYEEVQLQPKQAKKKIKKAIKCIESLYETLSKIAESKIKKIKLT